MWIIWIIVVAGIIGAFMGVALFIQKAPAKTKAKELLKQQNPDSKEVKDTIRMLDLPMADEESKELVRQLTRKQVARE